LSSPLKQRDKQYVRLMHYVRAHTHTTPAFLTFCWYFSPSPVHSIRFQETRIGACTRNRKRLCLFGTNRNNDAYLYAEASRKCITTLCRTHDDDGGLCRRHCIVPIKMGWCRQKDCVVSSSAFIYDRVYNDRAAGETVVLQVFGPEIPLFYRFTINV